MAFGKITRQMTVLAGLIGAAVFAAGASAQAQMDPSAAFCSGIQSGTVFNKFSRESISAYTDAVEGHMCGAQWASREDFERRARRFHLTYRQARDALGISDAEFRLQEDRNEAFWRVCRNPDGRIDSLLSFQAFYHQSDHPEKTWRSCARQALARGGSGLYAFSTLSADFTNVVIHVVQRGPGGNAAIRYDAVEAVDVYCAIDGQGIRSRLGGFRVPMQSEEHVIACTKKPFETSTFSLMTDRGPIGPIFAPGFDMNFESVLARIDSMNRQLQLLESEVGVQMRTELRKLVERDREIEAKVQGGGTGGAGAQNFGGSYTVQDSGCPGSRGQPNPYTEDYRCPAGFTATDMVRSWHPETRCGQTSFVCLRTAQ